MTCPTKAHLQQRHDQVTAIVNNARKRLLERVGICSSEEFRVLSEELESAWDTQDQARAAVDWHIQHHRCAEKRSRNGAGSAHAA
jgi:hypothetical protein